MKIVDDFGTPMFWPKFYEFLAYYSWEEAATLANKWVEEQESVSGVRNTVAQGTE